MTTLREAVDEAIRDGLARWQFIEQSGIRVDRVYYAGRRYKAKKRAEKERGADVSKAQDLITRPLTQADIPVETTEQQESEPSVIASALVLPVKETGGVFEIKPSYERHVVLSDLHYRNYISREYDPRTENYNKVVQQAHDERALRVVRQFMRAWQPTHIHMLGDVIDCPQISHFSKSLDDMGGLWDDIQGVRTILKGIRRTHPAAQMAYYLGNHEARLSRFIQENAMALESLPGLSWQVLLDAVQLGMPVYPYGTRIPILPNILELVHGDKIRAKSGYTAHAMLEKGVSGVSGHTHRLATVYKRNRIGMTVWAESGCLCMLDPDYCSDPDWTQGFVVIYVDRENARFHMDAIPVISGRIVYAGAVYEVE